MEVHVNGPTPFARVTANVANDEALFLNAVAKGPARLRTVAIKAATPMQHLS